MTRCSFRSFFKSIGSVIGWQALSIVAIYAAAVSASSCASSLQNFVLQPYGIENSRVRNGFTIAVIADLHNTIYGEAQRDLINAVNGLSPDLIFLVGDIMDERTTTEGTELLLSGIQGIAPTFYVTGNHEFTTNRVDELRDITRSFDVIILSDDYEKLSIQGAEVIVAGIEDPFKKKHEDKNYDQDRVMEERFRGLEDSSAYRILIAHRPERIEQYLTYPFDLIVSGHAHGGQWRFKGWAKNGLYAPNQGFFPKYAGGLYLWEMPDGTVIHIVSRGLSLTTPKILRINNPPELVFLEIQEKNE